MIRRNTECRFVAQLLAWHSSDAHRRDVFWWRGVEDPYVLFVVEVLLARTRAERVSEVARELVQRWPEFCSLARADETELEQMLRPLGFQRVRASALKRAAEEVCTRWGGNLPLEEEKIASLPRSGRYVANAVLIYSTCARKVAVDVNVARVVSRVFGFTLVNGKDREENLWALAQRLVECTSGCEVRSLNWALLDVGREICHPTKPRCPLCPVREICHFARFIRI